MATNPTTDPFELHCGICRHVAFQDEWSRLPYCDLHGREVDVRVGDICSEFRERGTPEHAGTGEGRLDQSGTDIEDEETLAGTTGPFHAVYVDGRLATWYCANCETADVAVGPMGGLKCNECGNVYRSTEWDAAYL